MYNVLYYTIPCHGKAHVHACMIMMACANHKHVDRVHNGMGKELVLQVHVHGVSL